MQIFDRSTILRKSFLLLALAKQILNVFGYEYVRGSRNQQKQIEFLVNISRQQNQIEFLLNISHGHFSK